MNHCTICFDKNIDEHHVRTSYNAGVGIKPADIYKLPLCRNHHSELHQMGEKAFWAKYNVNPFEEIVKRIELKNIRKRCENEL